MLDSALPRLLAQRAWRDPVLWRGFLKFVIGTTQQGSIPILLRIPSDVLQEVLDKEPTLVPILKRYVKDHPKSASTAIKRLLRGGGQKH